MQPCASSSGGPGVREPGWVQVKLPCASSRGRPGVREPGWVQMKLPCASSRVDRGEGKAAEPCTSSGVDPGVREAGPPGGAATWGCCPGWIQQRAPGFTRGAGPSRRRGAWGPGNARACPAPPCQRDSHVGVLSPDPRMSQDSTRPTLGTRRRGTHSQVLT